ncbi:homoserine dehydrogenase [Granulicella sp. 5B5]|uniref:homoserine dehydrogenase n=1 Tax=Granulicella sp. 5B5 TaxID=1617967 RepID=UPI0015F486A1|nr:homoserine dehydrogenase [Granulicella sp. 5B5]QMV18179.1 homoserine dehydrogenase [Granulicella sp. 5B5]
MANKMLRVGLLGFGTVGSSFAEVVAATPEAGVEITRVFNRGVERKRTSERAKFVPSSAVWTDNVDEVLTAADVDVVVELMGGLDPAEGWLRAALSAGKHVVTANKQLIAYRGAELFALAAEKGVQLLYNAAVAGGVPVIPGIAQGLSGDRITRISGIVNGTCNFILSSMESGADYGEVLKKAQAAGYAEADPSADVDGYDARAKLCVLARLALHAEINPDEVPAQTISTISAIDFAYAKELGCTVRQVAQASLKEEGVSARVGPMLVPKSSPIAFSHGTQNMVVTSGKFGGDVVFSGHGAGGHPTAVAVMSDVRSVAEKSVQVRLPAKKVAVSGDVVAPHYLRFIVADQPGIVAAIAGALAKHEVNIDSILQHHGHAAERLPFVVTTEPCSSVMLANAVAEMAKMPFMVETPLCLQILVVDDKDTD